jgi:hypothetical protein
MKKPGYTQDLGVSNQVSLGYNCHMDKDFDINEFYKKTIEHMNQMRKTPHECDYEYMVINDTNAMFFEICKLCLDTKGTIEI